MFTLSIRTMFLRWIVGILNSMMPGRCECDFEKSDLNITLLHVISGSSHDISPRWMPRELTKNKSTLLQVIVWHHQPTNHHLNRCWPSSMLPLGHNELNEKTDKKVTKYVPFKLSLFKTHIRRWNHKHGNVFVVVVFYGFHGQLKNAAPTQLGCDVIAITVEKL